MVSKDMPRLIVNTSNLRSGGALQVASTFIEGLRSFSQNQYFVFLPLVLYKSIGIRDFPDNFTFYLVDNPSIIPFFKKVSKQLSSLEEKIKPNCVFSLFGPTYWKPKSYHVMGFANGLYVYDNLPYIRNLPLIDKVLLNLKKNYHKLLLKKNADLYVVQTNDMKKEFSKFINVAHNQISVICGSYHPIFSKKINNIGLLPTKRDDDFWFVTISAYYPHKNLDIINEIAGELSKYITSTKVKFILTLPQNLFIKKFKYNTDLIMNVGPVDINDCPYLYSKSDALFLPTLVETFTASYPEAMIMKKPILTSDYPFSRSVCKDAALYFDPYDINDVMSKIFEITSNKDLYNSLINKGSSCVKRMPSFMDMTKKYLDVCDL